MQGVAGLAGVMLLFGVLVIVRNRAGKEVARIEVPDGETVEVSDRISANLTLSLFMMKNFLTNEGDEICVAPRADRGSPWSRPVRLT